MTLLSNLKHFADDQPPGLRRIGYDTTLKLDMGTGKTLTGLRRIGYDTTLKLSG